MTRPIRSCPGAVRRAASRSWAPGLCLRRLKASGLRNRAGLRWSNTTNRQDLPPAGRIPGPTTRTLPPAARASSPRAGHCGEEEPPARRAYRSHTEAQYPRPHDLLRGQRGPLVAYRNGRPVQIGVAGFTEGGDGCSDPGGFMELSGAQLAWVASEIPDVVTSWGAYTTPTGSPGQPSATYSGTAIPGAQRDRLVLLGHHLRRAVARGHGAEPDR
jgi:hypothetical protein